MTVDKVLSSVGTVKFTVTRDLHVHPDKHCMFVPLRNGFYAFRIFANVDMENIL